MDVETEVPTQESGRPAELSLDPPGTVAAAVSSSRATGLLSPSPTKQQQQQQQQLNNNHPSILVESLKQLTPLLTITSRVGRSLAELMSLFVRLSTSPLYRHRRAAAHHLTNLHEVKKEAVDVCMEVTNLLVDSLRWEVPMPQACSLAMQSPIRDWLFAG